MREDYRCDDDEIPIPDAISRDPERPERGLWGMINWRLFHLIAGIEGGWLIQSQDKGFDSDWQEPYIALLRALAWQIEQEAER